MTYIWNRAERVPAKSMPNVLNECFVRWEKNQLGKITEDTTEQRKQGIYNKINKQRNNLTEAVDKFNRK
jgi:uncharacterized protein YmfQ (DUF2313 family)